MKILSWERLTRRDELLDKPVAVTIGAFDGLHIGHQKLINKIVKNPFAALPLVLTFSRSPAQVLGKTYKGNILSFAQKMHKLEAGGVGSIVLIDFSYEFSTLTGKKFFRLLTECLDVKKLVVGYNFHFGRGRDTDTIRLKGMLSGSEIELEIIKPTLYLNEFVSSSRIRESIFNGNFSEARLMLAEDYRLELADKPTLKQGGEGWVSIPRAQITQVVPNQGAYKVYFCTNRGEISGEVSITAEAVRWKDLKNSLVREICFLGKKDD